jgi:hypothetical protein
MSLEECTKEKSWPILVETVHALVLYPNHKAYTRDVILPQNPGLTPAELAGRLGMPLGEALVILAELLAEKSRAS